MVRSHKYGGALMTQEQFKALDAIPQVIAETAELSGPVRKRAALVLANRIRVRCNLQGGADIPADLAVETLALLHELRALAQQHVAQGGKADAAWVDATYGGGEPWTPAIARRMKRMGRAVPDRPDWRALQVDIMPDKGAPPSQSEGRSISRPPCGATAPANLDEATTVLDLLRLHVSTGTLQPDLILAGINTARAAIGRAIQGSNIA
ncbi:hypothetical protein [Xanthomonas albilineans]|uniref:hypothetical protein n=1 Tax=Xanthomonas albilineans TaxID=29447 RepID=UPI0005F351EF|nr:hypothetical protein [Xanthomonas albilineans]